MHSLLFNFISQYVSLTEEEKKTLISFDIFRTEKKGSILLKQGQYSEEGYFVLKGCLRSYYIINGEEKTTAFYTEMEGLKPQCVINKEPSKYYISCVEDTILTVADAAMEAYMFKKFPRFETFCRVLSENLLAQSQYSFDEFKTSSPEQRYLSLIIRKPHLLKRVPQHQLASYIGIKPQSLSRIRARIMKKPY